jgi:hypothetical protein
VTSIFSAIKGVPSFNTPVLAGKRIAKRGYCLPSSNLKIIVPDKNPYYLVMERILLKP